MCHILFAQRTQTALVLTDEFVIRTFLRHTYIHTSAVQLNNTIYHWKSMPNGKLIQLVIFRSDDRVSACKRERKMEEEQKWKKEHKRRMRVYLSCVVFIICIFLCTIYFSQRYIVRALMMEMFFSLNENWLRQKTVTAPQMIHIKYHGNENDGTSIHCLIHSVFHLYRSCIVHSLLHTT